MSTITRTIAPLFIPNISRVYRVRRSVNVLAVLISSLQYIEHAMTVRFNERDTLDRSAHSRDIRGRQTLHVQSEGNQQW